MSRARIVAAFVAARWGRRFRDRAALERYQRRRIHRHLRFLRTHSPAYRAAPTDPARLGELPIMDKAAMMADFDRRVTVPVTLDRALDVALAAERSRDFAPMIGDIAVGLSSGTSGHRGVFLTTGAERDAWAGTVLAFALPPGRQNSMRGHRIALLLRAGNRLYDTVRSRAVDFRWFDLYDDLASTAAALAAYRPTILVAPASALRALAELPEYAGDGTTWRPDRVYSVAEVLGADDAVRIADAFAVDVVHQLYQCTEGLLARTCPLGTLHLAEDLVHIEREPLDGDEGLARASGDGERFAPIVTDFSRRSQPIIRYRLDDVLVARAEPCPCGSVLTALARIEGRESDILELDGRRVFGDLVSRAMVHATGFGQYRVIQAGPATLEVQIDDPAGEPSARVELAALWDRLGVAHPELAFAPYRVDAARKLRRVERAWPAGEDRT